MPIHPGAQVHPTALVSEEATLEEGVIVGPRCTIEGPVRVAEGCRLLGDVHLRGDVEIGPRTIVYPYACVGYGPQHVKYGPDDPVGGVRVGAGGVIREHATIHASMYPGKHTTIGERIYMMVASHIGHDCLVGDDVIMCNGALLAGHCEIAPRVYISGNAAIHQFCRVGTGAMVVGGAGCNADVPPFCTLVAPNMLGGLNLVGMRRAGIPRAEITIARRAYREVFRKRFDRAEQIRILDRLGEDSAPVREMAAFVRGSKRGVLSGDGRPRPHMLHWFHERLRPEAWAPSAHEELSLIAKERDALA